MEQLTLEEDQMQNHEHEASVTDPGHSHHYTDRFTLNDNSGDGPKDGDGHFNHDETRTSQGSHTGIQVRVKGVSSTYRAGLETRPKNMNVIYIMKVW